MDASLVIFAVQAGVRLGRKLNDVLVDETNERSLILPLGNLIGSVAENDALDYFREHPELVAHKGPYASLNRPELVKAYQTILALEKRLGDRGGVPGDGRQVVLELNRFEQLKSGFGAKHPLQRILGEVVEIAIDYFVAQPSMLEGDTNARKILSAFVVNLDNVQFSEGSPKAILKDVLLASLKTLDTNISLLDDDPQIQTLLGGITGSLIEDYDKLDSLGDKVRRENLVRRIASSVLKGGATAIVSRPDLFLRGGTDAEKLVKSALSQVVEGIADQEDLFTNASVELLFGSVLTAMGENADVFSDQKVVQELIRNTLASMTETPAAEVFSEMMVASVLQNALVTFSQNTETLFDVDRPEKILLAETLRVVALSLYQGLGDGRKIKDLFSKKHLLGLTTVIFEEVAKQPEKLLGIDTSDEQRTALAQITASVATAVAQAPERLISGEGLVEILRGAIQVTVNNVDLLLDLNTNDPRQNLLFKFIQQAAEAVRETEDPRQILSREVFEEIILGILPLVSSNIDAFLPDEAAKVATTIRVALALSAGPLKHFINGDNLPVLVERLLWSAIWSQMDLNDTIGVKKAALNILKEAA